MKDPPNTNFEPDYLVHPGEILKETIKERGIKQTELAQKCGMTEKAISEIINGKKLPSTRTAIALERVLGVSAELWCNLVMNYKLHKERIQQEAKE